MRIIGVAITVVSVLWAGAARAQGLYVGGAIGAEVVRTSSTQSGGSTFNTGSGEAFAGAIRVGAGITERFGVEAEFFRPGEIDGDLGGPIFLAGTRSSCAHSVPSPADQGLQFPVNHRAEYACAGHDHERAGRRPTAARRPSRARVSGRRRLLARRARNRVQHSTRHPACVRGFSSHRHASPNTPPAPWWAWRCGRA